MARSVRRALAAWRNWFEARLARIRSGMREDYSGYEMDLFNASAPTKARPKRKPPVAVERHVPGRGWVQVPKSRLPKAEKRERRAAIREKVVKRAEDAGGFCECGCNQPVRDDSKQQCYPEARGEMDHFWGRGKGRITESVESCWFLRPACHLAKTRNQPDARQWLQKFIAHCARYGYADAQARATSRCAFIEARASLPAAPRVRP